MKRGTGRLGGREFAFEMPAIERYRLGVAHLSPMWSPCGACRFRFSYPFSPGIVNPRASRSTISDFD
jgi:hypothetical protein